VRSAAVDGPISAHEAQTKGSDDDSQFDARAAEAFAELLASKDQDVLKEMLSLVYDAAIRAQFDEHIGAQPPSGSGRCVNAAFRGALLDCRTRQANRADGVKRSCRCHPTNLFIA
jgi:hypothetical protein